jgi:NADH-quinone oxidoreductase subunit C
MRMVSKMECLIHTLQTVLGEAHSRTARLVLDEVIIDITAEHWPEVAYLLRDSQALSFHSCVDVCGVDYSTYQDNAWKGPRFAGVYQLLSLEHNWRLRVRVFCEDDAFPTLPSVIKVWRGVNWFEREAFDLYGIVFVGHPDLRRLLTDYGFVGHPFRKDFPLSGHVEMRYDPQEGRVIYQPITIEPREITPRIIREEHYGV